MKLNELMNSVYDYEFQDETSDKSVALFKTEDGSNVLVKFEYWDNPECWEIDFRRDGKFDITGTGDAPKILSTVITIIKHFIREEKPKFFSFSANKKETSRVSLYDKLAKRIISGAGYVDGTSRLDEIDHKIMPGFFKNKVKYFPAGEQRLYVRNDMFL